MDSFVILLRDCISLSFEILSALDIFSVGKKEKTQLESSFNAMVLEFIFRLFNTVKA